MSDKKLSDYKLNRVNPFIDDTIFHVDKGEKLILMGTKNSDLLIDSETGELKAHSVFAKRIPVDKAEFRKIYISSVSAWFGLSKTGIKVFGYILSTIRPNHDYFIMDYEDCMEFTGYKSKKSIIDGLREMIDNKFIDRGKNQYVYYINPTVFFNGDRITFLKHYELRKEKETKKLK